MWTFGFNLAGTSPNPDNVHDVDTREEACQALRSEMREYADRDDDNTAETLPDDAADDDQPVMRATVDSILTDDGPDCMPDRDWSAWVEDGSGWRIEFWLKRNA